MRPDADRIGAPVCVAALDIALRRLPVKRAVFAPRIDSPQIALVTLPGAVPELSVDPGDPGDEAVGLDRAQDLPCVWVDLMNLSLPVLPDPERPLGPRETGVTAAARRRNRGQHAAGFRIDLLNAILGELEQVLAVE